MAAHPLGNVTTSSTTTAVRATNNQSDPAAKFAAQAVFFQALGTNTGVVYICDRATPTVADGTGILAEIPNPSASPVTRPAWSIGNPAGPNPFNAADFYVLPAVADEGVRVTVVRT